MGCIGNPDEYEAVIVDSLTQETISVLDWSSIQWQRARNQTTAATIRITSTHEACESAIDGLTAWAHMLAIVRNGERVWDGPVMGWSTGNSVSISARDRSAMLAKRLVAADLTLPNIPFTYDLYQDLVVSLLTSAGFYTAGVGQMPYKFSTQAFQDSPTVLPSLGVYVAGKWRVASLESIESVFRTLQETAYLSWAQCLEMMSCYTSLHNYETNGVVAPFPNINVPDYPTLSPETVVGDTIGVTVQADNVFTGVYKGQAGQGIAGFPNPTYPGDDNTYIPYALFGAYTDAEVGVGQFLDAFGQPYLPGQYDSGSPTVTLEQVTLRPSFGGPSFKDNLSTLLPGQMWRVDFPESRSLNVRFAFFNPVGQNVVTSDRVSFVALEQVDVDVRRNGSELKETVSVSVRPAA